jgi:hypothetical protein
MQMQAILFAGAFGLAVFAGVFSARAQSSSGCLNIDPTACASNIWTDIHGEGSYWDLQVQDVQIGGGGSAHHRTDQAVRQCLVICRSHFRQSLNKCTEVISDGDASTTESSEEFCRGALLAKLNQCIGDCNN